MTDDLIKQAFLDACNRWVCDGYALDIRFLARSDAQGRHICDAAIALNPLRPPRDLALRVEASSLVAGQIQRHPQTKDELLACVNLAVSGRISLHDVDLLLPTDRPYAFASDMTRRDRWFSDLHLQVIGGGQPPTHAAELVEIDNYLRASAPPFDGLSDIASWLGLRAPSETAPMATISIRVSPPIDLIFDRCSLTNGRLLLTLHAHPDFDTAQVGLAVRAVPGEGLAARMQIAKEIRWSEVQDDRREGKVDIALTSAESVVVFLMIGRSTVRRQWFLDPGKARNNRLLAMQLFDKELRMVRQAILESPESAKFEVGVAALLFLLGFSHAIQPETNAPDLIVMTPSGRMAIIECTTRIADVASKLGKLADRRGALAKALDANGQSTQQVAAVLVCRLPRDQIAVTGETLRASNIVLVAGEDLADGLNRVRYPSDPDAIFELALGRLQEDRLQA